MPEFPNALGMASRCSLESQWWLEPLFGDAVRWRARARAGARAGLEPL